MDWGPIFARELVVASRRRKSHAGRFGYGMVLLAFIALNVGAWEYLHGGQPYSNREMAWIARGIAITLVVAQVGAILVMVPRRLARAIAEERARRTLHDLLTTQLSSAEIILGKAAVGMLHAIESLAIGLPILLLLSSLGGIDPRLIVLAFVGSITTAFFLTGLSLLISTGAREGWPAVRLAVGGMSFWAAMPFVGFVLSVLWPLGYGWIRPIVVALAASSPTGVVMGSGNFLEDFAWMVGLQMAGGVTGLVLAIWLVRPAFRWMESGEGWGWKRRRQRLRWRLWPRPPCGDDPVLWKEMHTGGLRGLQWLIAVGLALAPVAGLGYGTWLLGCRAFGELWEFGYASSGAGTYIHRDQFNGFVRGMTIIFSLMGPLSLAGFVAESVPTERARQTWDSLLATPLTGREILGAKMRGAVWRGRGLLGLLVGLWLIGLALGAVHPLGFLAALVALIATTAFSVALGGRVSLTAKSASHASSCAMLPLLLMLLSALLPSVVWERVGTVLLGSASTLMIAFLALLSYGDVERIREAGSFRLGLLAGPAGWEPVWVFFATYALGVIGQAVGAWLLARSAYRRFDRLIGRPWKSAHGSAPAYRRAESSPESAPAWAEAVSTVAVERA
jgi:ABC-type Na+ efflux pump permease subunit